MSERKGAIELTPGFNLPSTGRITRVDLMRVLSELVGRIALGAVGDLEVSDVSFSKLISGLLTGGTLEDPILLQLDGVNVRIQSLGFVADKQRFYDGVGAGGQPTISSNMAVFTDDDVGEPIESNYLPANTTVLSRQSPTQITASANLLAAAVGGIFRLTSRPLGAGTMVSGSGATEINPPAIFRGRIETEGLQVLPGGTVIVGKGPQKMTSLVNGTFIWGNENGALFAISFDGKVYAGSTSPSSAPFEVLADGSVILRNTSQSNHAVNIGAIDPSLFIPVIVPTGGHFNTSLTVRIISFTDNTSIYYTTDGSTPDNTDTLYTGPFAITADTTVKARAYWAGIVPSGIRTAIFDEDGGTTVSLPFCDPMGSSVPYTPTGGILNVILASVTPGASIRYTLDGTTPSTTVGTLISPANGATPPSGNFDLNVGTTIVKAIAYKTGLTSSAIETFTFIISAGGSGGGGSGGGGRGNIH